MSYQPMQEQTFQSLLAGLDNYTAISPRPSPPQGRRQVGTTVEETLMERVRYEVPSTAAVTSGASVTVWPPPAAAVTPGASVTIRAPSAAVVTPGAVPANPV
jgi:hypothetical protein